MSYATVSHVQALNSPRTFGASTLPRSDEVVQFLDESAAVIDGILAAQGYQLPVPTTATGALKLLEGFNAKGAWALVERSAPNSKHLDRAEAVWDDAQKMLRDGVIELPGAPKDSSTGYARMSSVATPYFCHDMTL